MEDGASRRIRRPDVPEKTDAASSSSNHPRWNSDKTERSAYGIVTDLTKGGYVVKEEEEKDGHRHRY